MNVWILFWDGYDTRGVLGVYSTFHAAVKDWEFYKNNAEALRNLLDEHVLEVWVDDDWAYAIKDFEVK